MTMPDTDHGVAALVSQVLSKQGEQGEKLATISEQLRGLADIPSRLRDVELKQAEEKGSRDNWARILSVIAVLAAIAAVVSVFYKGG